MSRHDPESSDILATLEQPAANGIEVVPRTGNEIPHPNCLIVEPYREGAQDERLLATVEHYLAIEKASGFPWRITAVTNDPLDFNDAMALAMAYAKRQGVPVVVVNHDGMSSPSERQQTDTAVLNVRAPGVARRP